MTPEQTPRSCVRAGRIVGGAPLIGEPAVADVPKTDFTLDPATIARDSLQYESPNGKRTCNECQPGREIDYELSGSGASPLSGPREYGLASPRLDVLVVEDDEVLLALWTRTLCEAGYRVGAAASFVEGRLALVEGLPRLLITDIRLGAFNGLQLVALVRATEQQTRMLVLTGFADPVLETEAKRLGARYAVKPLSTDTLLAAVAEFLGQVPGG